MDEQRPDQMQPGQVISPRGADEPTNPAAPPEPDRAPEPTPAPAPSPELSTPPDVAASNPTTPSVASTPALQETNWSYSQEASQAQQLPDLPEQLTWTAAEFVAHEKGAKWYGLLIVGGVVASGLDYLITKDIFSTVIILLAAILFGVYAGHKPREQQYAVDQQGVWVGNKVYDFQNYKTFSLTDEGQAASVVFMPLKRFMPPLTIYVAPEVEDQVVDYLSAFLPFEQHKADAIDSLMRRIRF